MLAPAICSTSPSSTFYEFTVRQMRVAFVRAKIIQNEIAAAGVALKAGLISPENAIAHVCEIGAGDLLQWENHHDE
jgi:hypothetical protein